MLYFTYKKGILRLLDKAMKRNDSSVRFVIASEIHRHLDKCVKETDNFMGREDTLDKIKSYLLDENKRTAFIIHGPTGSGKSCLLGKVATSAGKFW